MQGYSERREAKREGMRRLILHCLYEQGNLSATEIARFLHRRVEVIRPRLTELVKAERLRDSGARRRAGNRGPKEKVYELNLYPGPETETADD